MHAHTHARTHAHAHAHAHTNARRNSHPAGCRLIADQVLHSRGEAMLPRCSVRASIAAARHPKCRWGTWLRHRFWLAERFATGKGCGEEAEQALPQDFEQAMHWCKVAAQAGHAASELLLGDLFHKAQGTEQNVSEAVTQAASGACCLGSIHSCCPTGKVVQACCRARKLGSDVPPRTDPPHRKCRRTQRS
jgi:hypothetical protein